MCRFTESERGCWSVAVLALLHAPLFRTVPYFMLPMRNPEILSLYH
jgi:hypothetical protein